ncbi:MULTISPECIES: plasmid SOS inhibition protein A [Rahnella]|uniref:Plasmid SOS inhibition protein A n=1 Tax=Rahnella laticis TaxID=2787622 RepID=A0ABS0EFL8_9GAMM|nr:MULTISPECIES: plasmid SOS inhibition protein A [Rahnella]MBF7982079.1 plasmid SOS inhibition protein A [Rahnella laticis]MBF8002169.1 plasmid SOS inhibition protein A [Rahnella sp. LAC-M12]
MIPRHLSLVPVNPFQAAALQAIIDVEDGRRRRGQYPYAVALLRQLRGGEAGRISATDVRRAASNYDPKDRAGEPKERYLAALDKLVESRGSVCPLPLSGCAVGQYFPQTGYRLSERQNRRWDASYSRREKLQEKARQQKRRRYQTSVAQAEIELAFVTPTGLEAWYKRQEKRGIYDDDLTDMLAAWGGRFTRQQGEIFYSGQPLRAILDNINDELGKRPTAVQWFDALLLSNRLTVRGKSRCAEDVSLCSVVR